MALFSGFAESVHLVDSFVVVVGSCEFAFVDGWNNVCLFMGVVLLTFFIYGC